MQKHKLNLTRYTKSKNMAAPADTKKYENSSVRNVMHVYCVRPPHYVTFTDEFKREL